MGDTLMDIEQLVAVNNDADLRNIGKKIIAGERINFDEGVLLFDRPAIAAGADAHRSEGDERLFRFFHKVLLEPYWITHEGV